MLRVDRKLQPGVLPTEGTTFRFLRILKFVGQATGSVAEYRVERSIFSLTSDSRTADTVCRGIHSRDHSEKQHMRNVSNSPDAISGKRFSIPTSISGGPSDWLIPDRIGSSRLEPKVVPGMQMLNCGNRQ